MKITAHLKKDGTSTTGYFSIKPTDFEMGKDGLHVFTYQLLESMTKAERLLFAERVRVSGTYDEEKKESTEY